jgi:hypothetical protein
MAACRFSKYIPDPVQILIVDLFGKGYYNTGISFATGVPVGMVEKIRAAKSAERCWYDEKDAEPFQCSGCRRRVTTRPCRRCRIQRYRKSGARAMEAVELANAIKRIQAERERDGKGKWQTTEICFV